MEREGSVSDEVNSALSLPDNGLIPAVVPPKINLHDAMPISRLNQNEINGELRVKEFVGHN
ncbi:hypothetical protein QQP08_012318 [Theobroma cacao]|nr:hypothetical protein QQP08_012318 [Theobroma cacao]